MSDAGATETGGAQLDIEHRQTTKSEKLLALVLAVFLGSAPRRVGAPFCAACGQP